MVLMKEDKQEKIDKKVLVVQELPTQQLRSIKDQDGNEYDVLTMQEALTEILENTRQIKKSVA